MMDSFRRSSRVGRVAGFVVPALAVAAVAAVAAPAGAVSANVSCGKAFRNSASTPAVKVQTMTAAGTRCPDAVKLVRAWSSAGRRPSCIQSHGSPGTCKAMGYACTNRYASLAPGSSPTAYAWVRYSAACSKGKRRVEFTVLVSALRALSFGDPVDSIAKFVFDLAKEPLKNFLMAQVGLPTTSSQLKAISAQIAALSSQLNATEARISAQIAELQLQGRLDYLEDVASDVKNLNTKYFIPLVASIVSVKEAEAKVPRDQAAIDQAKAQYNTQKEQFLNEANAIKVGSLAEKIHKRLQPTIGKGVLRQYGTFILTARRILNTTDSNRIIGLYSYLEENQALATWMEVEREIAVGGASLNLIPATLEEFTRWTISQRDGFAANGLHAAIPEGVVIDRGPDGPADSYTTVNKPQFAYFKPTDLTWAPFAFSPPSGDTVPNAVNVANGESLGGAKGWGVPSAGELYGFFSGLATRTKDGTVAYLRQVFVNNGLTAGDWLWDSESVQQRYCVKTPRGGTNCNHFSTAHRGLSTTNLSNDIHPQFEYIPAGQLEERFKAAKNGGLLVVRDTGQAQYLP